jgi:hypothetical protein
MATIPSSSFRTGMMIDRDLGDIGGSLGEPGRVTLT